MKFLPCNTTKYHDQLALFKEAERAWGRIDIVVANAGISRPRDPFAVGEDVEVEVLWDEMFVLFPFPHFPFFTFLRIGWG